MAVAFGEQRRRKEAMELLVSEITKGEDENIPNSIKIAIEVRYCCLRISHFLIQQSHHHIRSFDS